MSSDAAAPPVSPLDPGSPVRIEWTLPAANVVARWRAAHGIDVSAELKGVDVLQHCRCTRTGLGFFWPAAPGGPAFYEVLEERPWYYRGGKWEHTFACAHLQGSAPLLDIGCGQGDFLAAATAAGIEAEGIDFNAAAVDNARRRGLRVQCASVSELADRTPGRYGAITALQVLEHLPAPRAFLTDCLRLLRPGGRLVLAVPDADGWLARSGSVLELPPHHASHWNGSALRSLADLFPLDLEAMAVEPLSAGQEVDFAAATLRPSLPDGTRPGGFARRLLVHALARAVKAPSVAARLPGAALAAVFVKR